MTRLQIGILAGILALSWLLLIRWQEASTLSTVAKPDALEISPNRSTNASGTASTRSLDSLVPNPNVAAPSQEIGLVVSPPPAAKPLNGNTDALDDQQHNPTLKADQSVLIQSTSLKVEINLRTGNIESVGLIKYPASLDAPELPMRLLDRQGDFDYYLRRGFFIDNSSTFSNFIVEEHREQSSGGAQSSVAQLRLKAESTDQPGVLLYREILLDPETHLLTLNDRLVNTTNSPQKLVPYAGIYRNQVIPRSSSEVFGSFLFVGPAWFTEDDPYNKEDLDDVKDEPVSFEAKGGWVAMVQHYFLSALIPSTEENHSYQIRHLPGTNDVVAGMVSPQRTLIPGGEQVVSLRIYAGPKKQKVLRDIHRGLDLTVDYGWLWWIGQPIFRFLEWIYQLTGSWALSIILLTLSIKVAIYPLSAAGFRSMARMRQLTPKLTALKESFGEDRQKMGQETMALYKREGVNPLGGCLPLLVPMPIFIALYWVLLESVELRHSPLILWIDDLSASDPYFVMPILVGASMYMMQLLSPPSPTLDPLQQRILQLMPVFFTVFFLWLPSGLLLYWLVNNLLSLAQQWWIYRQLERDGLSMR